MSRRLEVHKAALATAAETAGVPEEALESLISEARRASRVRTRGLGSAGLERAVQSVVAARENE